MNSLTLGLIAFLGGIFTLSVISLTMARKIKIGGKPTVYIFLTLLPMVLLILSVVSIEVVFDLFSRKFLMSFFKSIIALEILVFVIFIFIKFNVFPGSALEKKENARKEIIRLDYGRRLLHYSIYGSVLYLLPVIRGVILIIAMNKFTFQISSIFLIVHFSLVGFALLLPFTIITEAFLGVIMIILYCMLLIISLNGTIRIMVESKQIRKKGVLYVFAMFIPVVNLIFMIHLCRFVKKIMKER